MPWWTLTDHHGTTIPTGLAQLYTCDATIAPLTVDPDGNPLHAGRTRRTPTRTQRRALEHRDGGCTFPGCTAALTWLDAHHIQHWERGGPTELDNLVLLCRRHHRVAHRTGWTLELDPHGWTHWTTPDGTTFTGQRHHRQPHQPDQEDAA